jgi:hypothetical protein
MPTFLFFMPPSLFDFDIISWGFGEHFTTTETTPKKGLENLTEKLVNFLHNSSTGFVYTLIDLLLWYEVVILLLSHAQIECRRNFVSNLSFIYTRDAILWWVKHKSGVDGCLIAHEKRERENGVGLSSARISWRAQIDGVSRFSQFFNVAVFSVFHQLNVCSINGNHVGIISSY